MSTPPPHSGYSFTKTLHGDIYPAIDPTKSNLSQPGKVVLITGAGRGLGRSIALRYAEAGVAVIIICARTASELDAVEKEINKTNSAVRVRKHTIDISDEKSVAALAGTVREEEGRLNVLVNNAGATSQWSPIAETDVISYVQTINVNLGGTYSMIRSFLPLLVESAKKESSAVDIVNISSIGANMVFPGASAYQISKSAVSRLTEFVELEYGKQGVNCVAMNPGSVLTEMTKNNAAIRDFVTDKPEMCGGFVVWLTKEQRTWLGGRYVSATWDVTELEAMKDEIIQGDKLKQRLVV